MREQNNIPNEYPENWDDGTYQTGATSEGKRQSTLITALLIATIFLGSIASALGIMNIRLLRQLGQQNDPVLPVAVDGGENTDSFLQDRLKDTPNLPENPKLQLQAGTDSAALSPEELAQTVQNCVASMMVLTAQGEEHTGQGLILSADGFLLTNAHLIANATSVTVQLPDGQVLPATVAGSDAYADLAVLYVQAEALTAATFKNDSLCEDGYVLMDTRELTACNVLEKLWMQPCGDDTLVLEKTDFASSSGPVFNAKGQVQGFLCRPVGCEEDGWMLSARQLMEIAIQLVEKGLLSGRPGWGIPVRELSNFCRQYWNLETGLEIENLPEDGAAQTYGLLSGDILLKLNGIVLTDCTQYYQLLLNLPKDGSATLEVFRAGKIFTVTLPMYVKSET